MTLSKNPYKGTRDFYPPAQRQQNYLFQQMHRVARLFGFEPYNGPLLESADLYAAKSGQELATQQVYAFEDRGGRQVAIRPEMTPTIARMIAKQSRDLPRPIRWYAIPNLMRYENPQRGRLREHWQLNADIFGGQSPYAEMEIMQFLVHVFQSFGADERHFHILCNHRAVVDHAVGQLGIWLMRK